ncbi:MAG: S-layer homology domain-containing protein, partial [Butyricicoccus sp.]|nr:S-layer homology domain-containing protein [Butyricicoccus sp.]
DVPSDAWYAGYVKHCQSVGIVSGKSATIFDPNSNVTTVELALMCLRVMGYDPAKADIGGSTWSTATIGYATEAGLLEDVNTSVTDACPRQWAAQLMYNMLEANTVRWSNDSETYTDLDMGGGKLDTVGLKYMKLVTYEGVLTGCGEFAIDNDTAGKDKIAMADVDRINGEMSDVTNQTWEYSEDVTALVGQYTKVLVGDKDKVISVFAVTDKNTTVTATFPNVEQDGDKIKVDGTSYTYEADAVVNGIKDSAAAVEIADLDDNIASGDEITFISNDGDSKFDLAIVNPMTGFGEVLYNGADSITVAGQASTLDKEDIIYPEDLAEGDYVAIYTDLFTGDDKLVKADKVTGEIEMTKDNDVRIDGTWYTLGEEDAEAWDDMILADIEGTPAVEDEYTMYVINGVVYMAELETAGSTDTAYVIAAPGSMTVDGNYQVKLLFSDNSQTVVEADAPYNASGTNLIGKLVTYETDADGVYELKAVDAGNKAGGDSVAISSTSASFDESTTRVKIDGTSYRVSSTAVVYIQYVDDDDTMYRAMTGSELNNLGDTFTADNKGGVVVVKDGLASVVMLKSTNNYLPGAGSDKLYGYVTKIIGSTKDYTEINVWTSDNEQLENVRVRGTTGSNLKTGDLISFTLSADDYLEGVKANEAMAGTDTFKTGAIKDFSMGDYVTFYKANSATIDDCDLTDDTKFVYLDTNNEAGVNGSKLAAAQKTGNTDEYYINAKYIVNTDGEIVMIACDITSRRWYGTGSGTVDTTLNPATAPSGVAIAGGTDKGMTPSMTTNYTSATASYTDWEMSGFESGTTDSFKFTVTGGDNATIAVSNSTIGGLNNGPYTSGTDITATSTGSATFTVTCSDTDKADVVYTFTVTVKE